MFSANIIAFADDDDLLEERDIQDREFFTFSEEEALKIEALVDSFDETGHSLASHIDYNALSALASHTAEHHELSYAEKRVILRRYTGFKNLRSTFRQAAHVKRSHTLDLGRFHKFLSKYPDQLAKRIESLKLYMIVLCDLFKVPLNHLRIDTSKVRFNEDQLVDDAIVWSVCYFIYRLGAEVESIVFSNSVNDVAMLHAAILQFASTACVNLHAVTNAWCPTEDRNKMTYLKGVQTDVRSVTHELCTVNTSEQLSDVIVSSYSDDCTALALSSVYTTPSLSRKDQNLGAFFARHFDRLRETLDYFELQVAAFDQQHLELVEAACGRVPNVVVYESKPWTFSIQEIFAALKKIENANEHSVVFILRQQSYVNALSNHEDLDELSSVFKFRIVPQENELRDDAMSQYLTF